MKEKIEFSEFIEIEKKLEIKTGTVVNIEEVPKSNKLIKLEVSFGDESKDVVTNIKPLLGENFKEKLEGKSFLFVTNLNPTIIMGIESHAMILPGNIESGEILTVSSKNHKVL